MKSADSPASKITPKSTLPTRRQAWWVGGPPGNTLARIRDKLAADGIDIVVVSEDLSATLRAVPSVCDLVLLNLDMSSHGESALARSLAKAGGVQLVNANTSYTMTRQKLVDAGVIAEKAAPTMSLNAAIEPTSSSSTTDRTEEIETFLRGLTDEQRQWAALVCSTIDDEKQRAVADTAVLKALDALDGIDEAALIAALRRRQVDTGSADDRILTIASVFRGAVG